MTFQLTEEAMQELLNSFDEMDTNQDGVIDPQELDQVIAQWFPGVSAETLVATRNAIIEQGDTNKDGKIDFAEFIAFLTKQQYDAMGLGSREQSMMDPEPVPEVRDVNSTLNVPHTSCEGDSASMQDVRGSDVGDLDTNEDLVGGVASADDGDEDQGDNDEEEGDPRIMAIMRNLTTEEVDMLRDAFIHMDRDSDGFVGYGEMMESVMAVVGPERFEPLREYLQPIFVVADKDKDNRLSLTEFLSSFADGPGVVPSDVVNACVSNVRIRLTDDEIWTLQQSFRRIDKNNDGFIDADELKVALKEVLLVKFPDLSEFTFNEIVSVVLASADADQDGKLSLSEYIRSFQEDQGVLPAAFIDSRAQHVARKLTKEEVAVLQDAFQALDSNNDGFIDYNEMYSALWDALSTSIVDKEKVQGLCDLIMVTADRNNDGRLTLTDFVRNFVQNLELMKIPVAAAQEKTRKAGERLQQLVESGDLDKMLVVFRDLDQNDDGYLQPEEIDGLLSKILGEKFPEWDEELLRVVVETIIDAADTDRDGKVSLIEFVNSFVEGSGLLPPDVIHNWGNDIRQELSEGELRRVVDTFKLMDANNDGLVSRDELRNALAQSLEGMIESEEHLNSVTEFVLSKVDINADGVVSLREFIRSFELNQGVLPVMNDENADGSEMQQQPDDDLDPMQEVADTEAVAEQERNAAINEERPRSPVAVVLEESATPTSSPAEPMPEAVAVVEPAVVSSHLTPSRNTTTAISDDKSPIVNDVSGVCVSDGQLRMAFMNYDVDDNGTLDRGEFRNAYLQMENYGLEPTPQEVDRLFSRYTNGGDRINYDEFCILMLQRSRM